MKEYVISIVSYCWFVSIIKCGLAWWVCFVHVGGRSRV